MERESISTMLGDRTPVLIRHVRGEDADALLEGFSRLSAESRLYRFLRVVKQLDPRDVDLFTHPDHTDHEAIGALAGRDRSEPAGIAHFFRLPQARSRAELALTVVDAYQRRGLGSLLLGRLLRLAAGGGIAQLDAIVHVENRGMLTILRQLGAHAERDGTTFICALSVHADPAAYPATRVGNAIRRAYALRPGPHAA